VGAQLPPTRLGDGHPFSREVHTPQMGRTCRAARRSVGASWVPARNPGALARSRPRSCSP